ncbi:T9SS type A sorting domain-containing protein [Rurimicrobium arvi]
MKKLLLSLFLVTGVASVYAQSSSCTYSGMLLSSGTAGPTGDDNISTVSMPFTFNFYGTAYTSATLSTNGFIWMGTSSDAGCCSGRVIPSGYSEPFIGLTQLDWFVDPGELFYGTVGTSPNRIFVVHYENVQELGGSDVITGEIQLYETTNEIRLVVASLTGFGGTGTMGIAAGDGVNGTAVGTRNASSSYSITTECNSLSSSSTVLPVSLISYNVSRNGSAALINWRSGVEENNDQFLVERSSDGKNYTTLATLKSKGNTTFGYDYSYTDAKPSAGKNMYRLSQVDFDKKRTYLGVKTLSFEEGNAISAQPNPFSDQLNIQLPATLQGSGGISVSNLYGREIINVSRTFDGKEGICTLDTRDWPAGVYFISITSDGQHLEPIKVIK